MDSFEDLSLAPPLVEALAAEGFERPTAVQEAAIPVVRRGHNLLLRAGPGSGTLLAYGAGLLDRLEPGEGLPSAVVLVASAEGASRLASSLAPLANAVGLSVGALGAHWALPERSDILFSSTADLLASVRDAGVKLDSVRAFVVDGAAAIHQAHGLDDLETLVGLVPKDAQRVVVSIPVSTEVAAFAAAHLKGGVHLPPEAAVEAAPASVPERGAVRYRVAREARELDLLQLVSELFEAGARHVLVFCQTDDMAADVGDLLTLHGFVSGAPGDSASPVWLGTEELPARSLVEGLDDPESVATVSYHVPTDADSLDRRHGRGGPGTVLALSRELPHLRAIAPLAGYRLLPAPTPLPKRSADALNRFRRDVERVLKEEDVSPHLLVLEPLFRRHDPAEVAAALAHLVREARQSRPETADASQEGTPVRSTAQARVPAWVRLFISVGERDGVRPGDLLGAITGETGIEGSRVGRIEIRDNFSRIDVEESVAERVVRALNGTTLKGRSIRADFDRSSARKPQGRSGGRGKGPPGRGDRRRRDEGSGGSDGRSP